MQEHTPPQPTPEQIEEMERQERIEKNKAIIALLDSWMEEDAEEQRETLEILMKGIDENRSPDRKLFS